MLKLLFVICGDEQKDSIKKACRQLQNVTPDFICVKSPSEKLLTAITQRTPRSVVLDGTTQGQAFRIIGVLSRAFPKVPVFVLSLSDDSLESLDPKHTKEDVQTIAKHFKQLDEKLKTKQKTKKSKKRLKELATS